VEGLKQNRRLARAVADAALANLRRLLTYKCPWYGSSLVEAEPFYPSSKRCSRCGVVNTPLSLWERTFRGDSCGLILDPG